MAVIAPSASFAIKFTTVAAMLPMLSAMVFAAGA
jgi:hypothetical protein